MRFQLEAFCSEFSELSDTAYELEIRSVPRLQIASRKCGDVSIVDLRGRSTLNGGESELLSNQLQTLVASGVCKLLLNLTELNRLDSTGVSAVVWTYAFLKKKGGELRLLRPSGTVRDVFNVMHLLEIILSFEDETQALASFEPSGHFAKVLGNQTSFSKRKTT